MLATLLWMAFAQIKPIDAPDFPAEAQERAVAATVRLKNTTQACDGSGVLVGRIGPVVYVLTAAHIADKDDKLTVSVFHERLLSPARSRIHGRVDRPAGRAGPGDDFASLLRTSCQARCGPIRPPRYRTAKDFSALTVGCNDSAAQTCLAVAVMGKEASAAPSGRGDGPRMGNKVAPETGAFGRAAAGP